MFKKRQKEPSEVLSTVPRWWPHGNNDLRGVFGLVQIHRNASCQGYFKWAKNICKHTHPKTHAGAMQLQTYMVCLPLTHICSSWELWGLQPVGAVDLTVQFISLLSLSHSSQGSETQPISCNLCHPVCLLWSFWFWIPDCGDCSQVLFLLFQVKIIFG